MEREVDKLQDDVKYKVTVDMLGFVAKDTILSGRIIKATIPFDVSPNQPLSSFFEEMVTITIEELVEISKVEYPFEEGDDYWTVEYDKSIDNPQTAGIVQSCWDDQSEEFHTPESIYFETLEAALHSIRNTLIKDVTIYSFASRPMNIIIK